MRLKDRVAVVTGGAGGIGRAIGEAYAREGAKVALADLDEAGAAEAARVIGKAGGTAIAVAMDVADEAQVTAGIDGVAETWGGIDVLVSNAGVQHIAALDRLDFHDWRRMMAIHVDGAFLTTRAALRHMYASGRGGSVIYMGSVHSKTASPLKAPYVTAKHALVGLCKTVAKEGAAHGVRANVICPGFVRTPLVEKQIPEQAAEFGITEDEVVRNIMLKDTVDHEFTTVEDVAELAVMFAAFDTNALTGQSLIVSHGWHME